MEKTTHSWRRVVGGVLGDSKRDNACSFQHLLETLKYLLIGQLKGRDRAGRILSPRILEAKVLLLLQRLNMATKKARDNTEAGQALLL